MLLSCHLLTGAKCDEFAGVHAGRLKIRIGAAPIDGAANAHLINFLARQFGVAKRAVHIKAGLHSRFKTVAIDAPAQFAPGLSIAPPGSTL